MVEGWISSKTFRSRFRIHVVSWLVAISRYCAKTNPNYSEPMHCLAGSLLWQEILGDNFFGPTNVCAKKSEHVFWKNLASLPLPKESDHLFRPLINSLLKNSFSTNFQGTWLWEGPIHFSRFVRRLHTCSKLFQSWSWSQEKKGMPFPRAIARFKG